MCLCAEALETRRQAKGGVHKGRAASSPQNQRLFFVRRHVNHPLPTTSLERKSAGVIIILGAGIVQSSVVLLAPAH